MANEEKHLVPRGLVPVEQAPREPDDDVPDHWVVVQPCQQGTFKGDTYHDVESAWLHGVHGVPPADLNAPAQIAESHTAMCVSCTTQQGRACTPTIVCRRCWL